jgi:hypothetical protein
MGKRIAAIAVIFAAASVAWIVLGSTIFVRTYNNAPTLRDAVVSNWGGVHAQRQPVLMTGAFTSFPERTRANASIRLEHRQKGLLWYSTYFVDFRGEWTFRNQTTTEAEAAIRFPLPSDRAIYDDLSFTLDGQPVQTTNDGNASIITTRLAPGATPVLRVTYRSQGLESWSYEFGEKVSQVPDFTLRVKTSFDNPDFPEGALSPTARNGGDLAWSYRNLLTGQPIRIAMPARLQPGPLAGRISYFAPVSLLFFFFVMFIVTTLRGIELHPMNYFFLAASFFAFHLLLAYLADHIDIHVAFVIAAAVSVFLNASYLRLVTGTRFATREAAAAQLVYLVLFSYAFFFEGFTGLAITIGAILTLFVTMQLTGRLRWNIMTDAREGA